MAMQNIKQIYELVGELNMRGIEDLVVIKD